MPFQKGNRANPGGRNSAKADQLKRTLLPLLPECAKAMQRVLNSDSPMLAVKEIYERVYGKTPQAITGENGGPVKILVSDK